MTAANIRPERGFSMVLFRVGLRTLKDDALAPWSDSL
jgi:hypothetical protein